VLSFSASAENDIPMEAENDIPMENKNYEYLTDDIILKYVDRMKVGTEDEKMKAMNEFSTLTCRSNIPEIPKLDKVIEQLVILFSESIVADNQNKLLRELTRIGHPHENYYFKPLMDHYYEILYHAVIKLLVKSTPNNLLETVVDVCMYFSKDNNTQFPQEKFLDCLIQLSKYNTNENFQFNVTNHLLFLASKKRKSQKIMQKVASIVFHFNWISAVNFSLIRTWERIIEKIPTYFVFKQGDEMRQKEHRNLILSMESIRPISTNTLPLRTTTLKILFINFSI